MTERKTWTPELKRKVFEIIADLKKQRPSDQEYNIRRWKEDCSKTARILTEQTGEEFTPNQIEWQTVIPPVDAKTEITQSHLESLAYAILSGYFTPQEFRRYIYKR